MGQGEEEINDKVELREIRRKARDIHVKSVAVAVVFTGLRVVIARM
jgi:hypothetical protein